MSDPVTDLLEWASKQDYLANVSDLEINTIENDWEWAVKDEWVEALAHYLKVLEALEWYADYDGACWEEAMIDDKGQRARNALEGKP